MFAEFMVMSSFIILFIGIWEVDAQPQDDWSAQTQSARKNNVRGGFNRILRNTVAACIGYIAL
jgi:hypothetical protein